MKTRGRTSSSFSGLPFRPPEGSCRSANHHPSVSTSTRSSLSRIVSAAVHTNTGKELSLQNASIQVKPYAAHLAQNDSPHPRIPQTRHRSSGTVRYTQQHSSSHPFHPDLRHRVHRVTPALEQQHTGIACRSRQSGHPQRCQTVSAGR